MARSSWSLEAGVAAEIVPADEFRDELTIQLYTAIFDGVTNPVYLAFGESPVSGEGICLGNQGGSARIFGAKARLAVNAICAGAVDGGAETYTHLEYRHTPNYPAWFQEQEKPLWPNKS